MNITAKELSQIHIGKKIKLGETYATIKKIQSTLQTVDVNAESLTGSLGPGMHYLSIPPESTVTIQGDEPTGPIGVQGNAVITSRSDHFGELANSLQTAQLSKDRLIEFSKATRIELIRNGKRDTSRYAEPGVKIYLQDDGRTLKIHFKEGQ